MRLEDKYSGLRKSAVLPKSCVDLDMTAIQDTVNGNHQVICELKDAIIALQTKYDKQEVEVSKLRNELNNERAAVVMHEEEALSLNRKIYGYISQIDDLHSRIREAESCTEVSRDAMEMSMNELRGLIRGREAMWAEEKAT